MIYYCLLCIQKSKKGKKELDWLLRLLPEGDAQHQWDLLHRAREDPLPVGLQDWQLDDAWQAEARKCGLATVNDDRWSVESHNIMR